ncbi:sensor histidine kinase [Muriicola sp. Z0-33]|uniref:sensor histidine kinase n=1 Tax=Muriicola sp. Z0-33 TaxID=2816957 RepID=UPI0022384E9B|nr:sensor histidine kinase [Muriicola sp. Z0-33]MCW5516312.1 sensor histidine kinase [Muriicola sp. Z0-33]
MKIFSHNISKILIHLLFWALFIFVSLFVFSDYYWKENPFLQYFAILVVLVYVNSEFLLPYFLKRRIYLPYAILITTVAVVATQLYCNYLAQCGCSLMKCLSDYLWQTLVPIVFFSFVWMLYRYLEKQEEISLIKKENTLMELQYLKSQINPHVLFNNLNTIYSYALEKPDQAPELILKLSDNLKHVLYESNGQKVPLTNELEYISNYIDFQRIRTENIKEINYSTSGDFGEYEIAPLLLITLIENAFKHSAAKSTISITISVHEGVLECNCKNLVGLSKNLDEHTPIGLDNLKKRLSLLYKNKHELTLSSGEEFIAILKLDLR